MTKRDFDLKIVEENWERLPLSLKIRIVAIVAYYTWRRWTWLAWLRWTCIKSREGV